MPIHSFRVRESRGRAVRAPVSGSGSGRQPGGGAGRCWRLMLVAAHVGVPGGPGVVGVVTGAESPVGSEGLPVAALKRLSLEELANIEVTSVEKRAEPMWSSAAAVYVLTGEDVQRAGVTTLADSLRYVPGLSVASVDANNWAVGARGFGDLFANKLLVMIDGRSVYTPLYSGVFWQYQDVILEDLDRIEVVRGPGATVWGANAVNGVINILTKPVRETQGLLFSAGGGNLEPAIGAVRYGVRINDTTAGRVYGKYASRENFELSGGGDANDRWTHGQGGFRIDWEPSTESLFTLQSDVFGVSADQSFSQATLTPPAYGGVFENRADATGVNVLGRWTRRFSGDAELTVQAYYDLLHQEGGFYEFDINLMDVEIQHRFAVGERHEVIAGAGYRRVEDRFDGGFKLDLDPHTRSTDLASVFVQDEVTLVPDELALVLGTKAEHNDFTGFEVQPGARMAWTPVETQTVWGSVARAVRTPSRAEHDLVSHVRTFPPAAPGRPPAVVAFLGDDRFAAEDLLAFELGYRFRPVPRLSVDLAVFYNLYEDLRTVEPGAPDLGTLPAGYVTLPVRPGNRMRGETYGGEVALGLQVADGWRVRGGYSFVQIQMHRDSDSGDATAEDLEGRTPDHQVFLVSQWDLPGNVTVDAGLRHVARLASMGVRDYTTVDVRVAWTPRPGLEFSVVGRNLSDDRHPEFGGSLLNGSGSSEVPRSILAKVTWRY